MGCAGVMLGRAAIGDPFIFQRIGRELNGSPAVQRAPHERLSVSLRHLDLLKEEKGELSAVYEMRKQLSPYLRGLPKAKELTNQLMPIKDFHSLRQSLEEIVENLR